MVFCGLATLITYEYNYLYSPHYGFTANYVLTMVDDAFLHHLHKVLYITVCMYIQGCFIEKKIFSQNSLSLQLNAGDGLKYQTLAVATVQCQELIASSGVKVHGRVSFSGVGALRECVCVGSVDYWVSLKHPLTQATKKYQVLAIQFHSEYSNLHIFFI